MSTTPFGVAVLGTGAVGRRFIALMDEHPSFRVVAVADTDPAVLRQAARPGLPATLDPAEAVAADGVDLVYVAAPPAAHAHLVDLALQRGCALLCEKPLGIDLAESRLLVQRVEASGLPAAVNFVHASAPAARALTAPRAGDRPGPAVPRGERVEVTVELPQWPRPFQAHARWLAERAEGGPTREVVSHFLFLATRLLGPLQVRSSEVRYPDGPAGRLAEQAVTAHLTNGDGADVHVHVAVPGPVERVEVAVHRRGADGAPEQLVLRDFYRLYRRHEGADELLLPEELSTPRAAYLAQLDDLAALLHGEPHTSAGFAEAEAVQRLVEGILGTGRGAPSP